MKMKLGARRRLGIAIRAAVLLACLCVVLVPFYIIVTNSFKPYADIARDIFSLPGENFTFDNYLSAWDRLNFGNSLKNTAIITVLSNVTDDGMRDVTLRFRAPDAASEAKLIEELSADGSVVYWGRGDEIHMMNDK